MTCIPDPDEQPIRRPLNPEPERSPFVIGWLLLAVVVAVVVVVVWRLG